MLPQAATPYRPLFRNAFVTVLCLTIVLACMRVVGMIGPPALRMTLPIGFICMMLVPFLFLDKDGRSRVGFRRSRPGFYHKAVLWGVTSSVACFLSGWALFGTTADNWFITVRNSYLNTFPTAGMSAVSLFLTFTIPAVIFSPLGEEIFFRGVLQEALREHLSTNRAMIVESAVFGVVHIVHHGLVRTAGGILFFPLSGVLWMMLMFATAYGFAWLREHSGSLYPAMVAHACFNVMMNVFIIFVLWEAG